MDKKCCATCEHIIFGNDWFNPTAYCSKNNIEGNSTLEPNRIEQPYMGCCTDYISTELN